MKRLMVNLDDSTGEIIEQRATAEKRSVSSYIALLIEADLRKAGLLPIGEAADHAARLARVEAALAANPALAAKLDRLLAEGARATRSGPRAA